LLLICQFLFGQTENRPHNLSVWNPSETLRTNDLVPDQHPGGCGTITSPELVASLDSLQSEIDFFTAEFMEKSGQMTMVTIPIKAHIIRRSDGTGGLSLSEWYAALDNLNAIYQEGNLNFVECGAPNIIQSDVYFDFHGSEEFALHNTYGVTKVLNVYIPGGELLTSTGTEVCGYANYPWAGSPDLVLVASNCMTISNSFAHEVGHYLGLYHTHGITQSCGPITDELVNGNNCNTSGDRICDTPADPGLRTGSDCENFWVDPNCIYIGTVTDANGQMFMPNTANIMSYSRYYCVDHLSPGQLARAYFYATTPPRSNLVCTPCSNAPVNLSVTSTGYSHISLTWDSVPGAVTYQTRVRRLPNGSWELELDGSSSTERIWSNRIPCSEYEIQVRVNCGNGFSPYNPSVTTQTLGCGDNYCYAYGLSLNQWIAGVGMAEINNPSGNGYGHSNFTNLQANVARGQSYSITLTPGTNAASTTVYWRVWIDYNGDGDFADAGEQVVSMTGSSVSPVTASIAVPQSAVTGATRMRAIMSTSGYSTSCATFNAVRDVEDYTINIQSPCPIPSNLTPSSSGYSHVGISWDSVPGATSYKARIRRLPDFPWEESPWLTTSGVVWINRLPCTNYEIQVRSNCGTESYDNSIVVQTQGCEDNYCYSYGTSWDQWVAGVDMANITNNSVNGYGHSNFTALQADVVKGQSYPITLTPGTNAASTTVYWRVWIDYNGDGDFGDFGEQVVSLVGNSLSPVSANIAIPQSAAIGATRMRVTMSTVVYSASCATSGTRDVEDYTINIQALPPPCSAPVNLSPRSVGYAHLDFGWNPVPGAVQYQNQIRLLPNGDWTDSGWFSDTTLLYGLDPCQEYEFQVRADCGNSNLSAYSSPLIVQTQGCDDNYCYSYGRSWWNWIAEVSVAGLSNPSGNGYGHSDFTDFQVNMEKGQSYPVSLSPGTADVTATTVFWRVWIDYNGDGDFEDTGEQVLSTTGSSVSPVTDSVTIPTTAATGPTRMRVSMSVEQFAESCTIWPSNDNLPLDVEDYTVNIQPQVVSHTAEADGKPLLLSVFPNPASDAFTVVLPGGVQVLEITDAKGYLLKRIANPNTGPYQVDTADFAKGFIWLSAWDEQGRRWSAKVILK